MFAELRSALHILKGDAYLNSDFIGIEDKENRFHKHHKATSLDVTFIKTYFWKCLIGS